MIDEDRGTPLPAWHRLAEGSPEWRALEALGNKFDTTLRPRQIQVDGGGRIEVEGTDEAGTVIVQFVLNSGTYKSAFRNKAQADMFKLVWLRSAAFPGSRCVLCISPVVAQVFGPNGWVVAAARDLGIEVYVLGDDDSLAAIVSAAR
jgi:hypothetical protein